MLAEDSKDINFYRGTLGYDNVNTSGYFIDSTFNIYNDALAVGGRSFFTLNYSDDDNAYSGTASLFFQSLADKNEDKTPYVRAVLVPYAAASQNFGRHINGKTVNRVAFHKNNIVLRIYYTVPTVNQN